jgi:ribonuclease-3
LVIAEYLYLSFPETPEGELSALRSRLVEGSACMLFIQKLDLEKYLLLGKGERMNDGRGRETILADLFEALVGAIYLDGGLKAASHFIFDKFQQEMDAILAMPLYNWKAILQDYCQKKFQKAPIYKVLDESGPDHSKNFTIAVMLDDVELGQGQGASKKIAQQAAAEHAFRQLKVE